MMKNKQRGWRQPQLVDELMYSWNEIVETKVDMTPINNRGHWAVPCLEGSWGA